ncbi:hypothetical protein E2C01_007618 [Portunus trituberculatus]|uniref:Uncharacterized protein n=1 Tax=Portunus trituberculatus TaxID=210409 RepID=A0A5B7CYM6_PORTR|nr:hypothetical protein [Portunus trituberculatus]
MCESSITPEDRSCWWLNKNPQTQDGWAAAWWEEGEHVEELWEWDGRGTKRRIIQQWWWGRG